ncbi:MAG: OmpH family outer membrane protein [Halofilum sp. (in: g-proteobacteria)]|nr:OmpH family outer membrane protein [Halofilum sp. (in: g-proteobacteria)]
MRKSVTCLLFMVAMLPGIAVAESKLGYVDVPYLIDNSPQAKAASGQLEDQFGPKQQQLRQKQQEFQQLQQKLQKDGLVMSDEERAEAENRLNEMQREIQRMQQAFREDLNIERNNAFKGVRQAVMAAVEALAKEEGYDLVVGQGALYASDAVNLTERVLDRMKANYDGNSQ